MSEASESGNNASKRTAPLLALERVSKVYLDGSVRALDDVSLKISRGEFACIMGPSGCGKSTLLNLLGALDRPTTGEVYFDGLRMSVSKNLDAIRAQHIGFVFQSFYLLPNLTAVENVQLPMFESNQPASERASKAEHLLARVGLSERARHLPNQLSIGQRQRVAIARALANDPELILADEPTGSLDSQSGREIMAILADLNASQSTTLVVVTHDANVAAGAQRVVRMLDGRVLEDSRASTQN